MKYFIWIFVALLFAELCRGEEFAPIVQINGGKVRGIVQQSEDGHNVYAYHGIRYGLYLNRSKII